MKQISDKELIEDLRKIAKEIGKIPSVEDYRKLGKYGEPTIKRRFGSWNKALKKSLGKVNTTRGTVHQFNCTLCDSPIRRQSNVVKKNKSGRFFCSKSCSATYNNLHKTHGTRRSKLEIWLEEQLVSFYTDFEIQFNKKDAINSELDIYIPSLRLAFELNGIYHYEPIHGKKKLSQIQNNDHRKFQACLDQNISLCIIDTSSMTYFKANNAQKYLDIITEIIERHRSDLDQT